MDNQYLPMNLTGPNDSVHVDIVHAGYGWQSDFPTFHDTSPRIIRTSLESFLQHASSSQVGAWEDSIPRLQREVRQVCSSDPSSAAYTAILEYELPLESRRPDVVFLINGAVVVLELKRKATANQADLDQASAYARDLRSYHRLCVDREVHAVLVPTESTGYRGVHDQVHLAGPDAIHQLLKEFDQPDATPLAVDQFLRRDAYCPLPTLVEAARELFNDGKVRDIPEARADTDPAVEKIASIARSAAATRTRHLVLITGVPGSGKTLVGLRAVHSPALSDLAVDRGDGKPTAPGIFLSGNGPLVEVLQYELREAGDGKTFVRDVLNYVRHFLKSPNAIPPHHVIVFDEAQRAWDADQVAARHALPRPISEPEAFIEFGERIPEWCVLIGLIGSGQEIHVGEESGLAQWQDALAKSSEASNWTVHAPRSVLDSEFVVPGSRYHLQADSALELTRELRFHMIADLDEWVDCLLDGSDSERARDLASSIKEHRYRLGMTRDLETAKRFLRERYEDEPDARFGLVASSKDKALRDCGVPNDFVSVERVKRGPWYADGEDSPRSCRHLEDCLSEFKTQGLELDSVLLAWGTDLIRDNGAWSNEHASNYKRGTIIKDAFKLRMNAYRVLLTRGRDGSVIFVPPLRRLDETAAWLQECGVDMIEL